MTEPFKGPFQLLHMRIGGVEVIDADGFGVSVPLHEENAQWLCDRLNAPPASAPASTPDGWVPTHRHYKGGLYQKLLDAPHTETNELLTVYRNASGSPHIRPKTMFDGPSPHPDLAELRFTPILASPPPSTAPGVVSDNVGKAGNHLAAFLVHHVGADFAERFHYRADHYSVLETIQPRYCFDVWSAWASIMLERDRLTLPRAGDGEKES